MNDQVTAPEVGAGEPVTVITPAADTGSDLSVSQAARALAAARQAPKEPPAESAELATAEPELVDEANADPAEEQIIGEATEEADPAAEPPIERPRSWTKDVDDTWQTLPRAVQEKIASREQERETTLRRSQNEHAEKLKGLTAKEQAVEQAQQQYEAKLPALMQALLDAQSAEFSDIKTMDDVKRMSTEDPFRKIQWDTNQQTLQAVAREKEQAERRQQQEQQSKREAYTREQNEKLIELLPEMKDPAKANELRTRAVSMLIEDLGFTESELSTIMQSDAGHRLLNDARWQKLIATGLKYADIQKAKTAAVAKPVPPVQRPGVSRPANAAVSEALQALERKATSSGSLKDAQAWRAAQLASQRRRTS